MFLTYEKLNKPAYTKHGGHLRARAIVQRILITGVRYLKVLKHPERGRAELIQGQLFHEMIIATLLNKFNLSFSENSFTALVSCRSRFFDTGTYIATPTRHTPFTKHMQLRTNIFWRNCTQPLIPR